MSTRREFLRAFGPTVLAVAGASMASGDGYQPVGYLDTDSPGADRVEFVTLDGELVESAFRLNDTEGWVEHYGRDEYGHAALGRPYHRTGVVRVHWKTA